MWPKESNMMPWRLLNTLLIVAFWALLPLDAGWAWETLDEGLFFGQFAAPQKPTGGDSKILVLKIDPKYYRFKLFSASEFKSPPLSARDWAMKYKLSAAINASMYRADEPLSSTGYMKNFLYTNNPSIHGAYGAFFVANPVEAGLPETLIIDRYLDNWRELIKKYHTVIQNFRMIAPGGKNAWNRQGAAHGISCVATDKNSQVLFIHCRSNFTVRDFAGALLALPLDIQKAMYVEGGPEATLFINPKPNAADGKNPAPPPWAVGDTNLWLLPNVLGIVKK